MNPTSAASYRPHVNKLLTSEQRYAVFVRAIELQQESAERLQGLISQCKDLKEAWIALGEDSEANAFLCFEQMATALFEEIQCYLALKADDADGAWNHLINAEGHASSAMKAHEFASHLEGYIKRLYSLEEAFFPLPVFFSSGFIVKKSQCSICGSEYGECDHIKGRPYMGKICARIITEAELLEGSVVSDPADRRCRALSFTDEGVTRNAFTLRVSDSGKTTNA